jgi:hypothetical protein
MPNGAEFLRREIPNYAESRTARHPRRRRRRALVRSFRRSGFRALWDRRRSEFSGVRNSAPSGIWRR